MKEEYETILTELQKNEGLYNFDILLGELYEHGLFNKNVYSLILNETKTLPAKKKVILKC